MPFRYCGYVVFSGMNNRYCKPKYPLRTEYIGAISKALFLEVSGKVNSTFTLCNAGKPGKRREIGGIEEKLH